MGRYYRRYCRSYNSSRNSRPYRSHRHYGNRRSRSSGGGIGEGLGHVAYTGARVAVKAARTGYRAYRTARTAARIGYRIAKAPFQIGQGNLQGISRLKKSAGRSTGGSIYSRQV